MSDHIGRLHGIYAAVPAAWDESDRFDATVFRDNVARLIDAGVHGVYTTGTDGEWHALEFDEFGLMVDAFAAEVRDRAVGTQVGCTWINTRGAIQRARYALERGICTVQVALPMWLPLTGDEVLGFFRDLSGALPDARLIHYNTHLAKNFLQPSDYRRIHEKVPSLIGTKFLGSLDELIDIVRAVPELVHFASDGTYALGRIIGARGIYSWLANINPEIALALYAASERGDLPEAVRLQSRIREFESLILGFLSKGYAPIAVLSVAIALSGFLQANLRLQAPYRPMTAEDRERFERAMRESFPEFLWAGS